LATLLSAAPALAEDLQFLGPSNSSADLLTSAGFTLAIALLAVLTGGVAYLTYCDFMDRQTESSERLKLDREKGWAKGAPKELTKKEGPGDPLLREGKKKGFGGGQQRANGDSTTNKSQ